MELIPEVVEVGWKLIFSFKLKTASLTSSVLKVVVLAPAKAKLSKA